MRFGGSPLGTLAAEAAVEPRDTRRCPERGAGWTRSQPLHTTERPTHPSHDFVFLPDLASLAIQLCPNLPTQRPTYPTTQLLQRPSKPSAVFVFVRLAGPVFAT